MQTDRCRVCKKRIRGGVAYFDCGAVIDSTVLEKHKLDDSIMEGFCDVGYHGSDPDMVDSVNVSVLTNIPGGQHEISFCSLICLRRWFSDIVDQLEQAIQWRKDNREKVIKKGDRESKRGRKKSKRGCS